MDDLAVADTGNTGHYLTLDLPCNNKQQAFHRMNVTSVTMEVVLIRFSLILNLYNQWMT